MCQRNFTLRVQRTVQSLLLSLFVICTGFQTAQAQLLNPILSCNDYVQVSLDETCHAIVTLDHVLEGAVLPDECLSFVIYDETGSLIPTSPELNGDYLGQELLVQVFNNCSNTSCWTYLWIEDHIPVEEDCDPLKLECYDSTFPGDALTHKYSMTHTGAQGVAIDIGTSLKLNYNVPTVGKDKIHNIELYLYISGKSPEHYDNGTINQISAKLISPGGSEIILFTEPEACGNGVELKLTLSDYASKGNDKLDSPESCSYSPFEAIVGEYQPEEPFHYLQGVPAGGMWTLYITNAAWPNEHYEPKVIKAEATFYIVHDYVYVPGTGYIPDAEYVGNNTFVFPNNNPCEAQTASFEDNIIEGCDNVAWDCILSPEYEGIDGLAYGDVVRYEGDCWVFQDYSTVFPQPGTPDGTSNWLPFFATNFALSAKIERCWTITDGGGNVTECCQDIYIEKTYTEELCCPYNYDDIERPAFRCTDNFETLENGAPAPSVTGYPYSCQGKQHYLCGNLQTYFEDIIIDLCPNSFKVIRQWSVLDWCNSEVYECNQIIKVLDDVRPIVDCNLLDVVYMDQNPYKCGVDYVVPEPNVILECGSYEWTVGWIHTGIYDECIPPSHDAEYSTENVYHEEGQVIIKDLPKGCNWVKYIITDECGNVNYGECKIEVKVVDNVPPVPVCDEHTVVSVSGDGYAHLFAYTIDDGSWDNCFIDYMEVAKMTDICHPEEEGIYHPYVKFCCEEIGSTIMVALRVWDYSGNSNTCMTEVVVQDKIAPEIYCPDNIVMNCFDDYEDLYLTGEPVAHDNCVDITVSYTDNKDLNQCGVGTIERTWKVVDKAGLYDSCTQVIDLVNFNPFYMHPSYWPVDKYLTECYSNTGPDVTGYPFLPDDPCSLVDATYKDQVFEFVDSVCLKIIRTWTVIDWCQYDPVKELGIWSDVQIIKLNNFNAPEITSSCEDIVECGYGPCEDQLTLSATAEDDCTPEDELVWSYRIDIGNDGIFNPQYGGNGSTVTDIYPFGTHRIEWSVEDRCGNVTLCEYLFTLNDCKEPTPYCVSSLTTVVMNNNGQVEVWASDFDFGSYDNCSTSLNFSFSEDEEFRSILFTCADIPNGQSVGIPLEIWMTDDYGNQDFCKVQVQLQDNEGDACLDVELQSAVVSGSVYTEHNEMVEEVEVMVESNQPEFPRSVMTEENGQYQFEYLFVDHNYDIRAQKSGDILNGVSTLDLVLMQKHILGLAPFDSPYKIIAADGDNNQKVSALDLVTFRKLILGVTEELPNDQQSWRFVEGSYEFDNPTSPFPFVEVIHIDHLNNHMMDQNLIAVKIGDVNASAQLTSEHSTENRNNPVIEILTDNKHFEQGEQVEVILSVNALNGLAGLQTSFEFDADALSFSAYDSKSIVLDANNFGMHSLDHGMLSFSWNDIDGSMMEGEHELMILRFKANQSGDLKESFSMNSSLIRSEAYNQDLETLDIELVYRGEVQSLSNSELYQNIPNPFSLSTRIGFELANEGDVTLHVFDTKGRLIYEKSAWYNKGYQEIVVEGTDLDYTGLMYYTLQTKDQKLTRKMIRIK